MSNQKRAATWFKEHVKLSKHKFHGKSSKDQDNILETTIKSTYSRYGCKQRLSVRSWKNLFSGLKVLYNIDVLGNAKFVKSRKAYSAQIQTSTSQESKKARVFGDELPVEKENVTSEESEENLFGKPLTQVKVLPRSAVQD